MFHVLDSRLPFPNKCLRVRQEWSSANIYKAENASQALHSAFPNGLQRENHIPSFRPQIVVYLGMFYMHRFNFGNRNQWLANWSHGPPAATPSFTAVCAGFLYHSRAPHRKQAAKPNILPIHPFTEPYSKVIISRGWGRKCFSLFDEFGGWGATKEA